MAEVKAEKKQRSVDPASLEMLQVATRVGVPTVWDRLDAQKAQCRFGREGLCCRNCFMGPCRVNPGGKGGLPAPEAAEKHAGRGLQEVCRAVGIPPVLHAGSCVDKTRILTARAEMAAEDGIGDSFDKLPVAGAAPEWMSEKAIAIGMYFVASGISVVIGQPLPVEGSDFVVEFLTRTLEDHFGATWAFEADPVKAAYMMIDHIDRKRADLGLPPPMYEVPYAPKTASQSARAARPMPVGEAIGSAVGSCPGPARIED